MHLEGARLLKCQLVPYNPVPAPDTESRSRNSKPERSLKGTVQWFFGGGTVSGP